MLRSEAFPIKTAMGFYDLFFLFRGVWRIAGSADLSDLQLAPRSDLLP
jgi:hypothetical protein